MKVEYLWLLKPCTIHTHFFKVFSCVENNNKVKRKLSILGHQLGGETLRPLGGGGLETYFFLKSLDHCTEAMLASIRNTISREHSSKMALTSERQ